MVRGGKDTGCSSALPATVTCEEGNVFVNTTQWCNGDFAEFTNGIFILGIVISMSALAEQGADHGSSDIDSGSMDFVSCNIRPPRDEDGDHVVRLSAVFCLDANDGPTVDSPRADGTSIQVNFLVATDDPFGCAPAIGITANKLEGTERCQVECWACDIGSATTSGRAGPWSCVVLQLFTVGACQGPRRDPQVVKRWFKSKLDQNREVHAMHGNSVLRSGPSIYDDLYGKFCSLVKVSTLRQASLAGAKHNVEGTVLTFNLDECTLILTDGQSKVDMRLKRSSTHIMENRMEVGLYLRVIGATFSTQETGQTVIMDYVSTAPLGGYP